MTALVEALRRLRDAPADAPLVEYEGRWWTWGEVSRHAAQLEARIEAATAGEHVRVAVVLGNRPASVAALLATLGSGRPILTLNPMQPAPRVAAAAVAAKPDLVLAPPALLADPEFTAPLAGVPLLPLSDAADPDTAPAQPGAGIDAKPGDVAVEIFTSGTTGSPKRIALTFRQLEVSLASALAHTRGTAADQPLLSGRPGLVALPLVHISGLWGVLQGLCEARPFVLLPRFTVDAWVAAVAKHRPPVTGLPPAAIRAVLDADVPREQLSSLRALNSGTAPLDPALSEEFTARFGIPILSVYGATEFSGAVAGWSIADHRQYATAKKGSVGRAFPGVSLRTVTSDGAPTATGEVGQLEVRTPQAGRTDWVRTNDLARIDDDGFVWIVGRADDVIIRGGFKISPVVVAAALTKHHAVREASVLGLPDSRLGQVPVAAVELELDVEAPDPEDLREFCRAHLTAYEVPTAVVILPALPRSASMKVDRTALTAMVEAALVAGAPAPA
ncbi:class I adenylate-forming enzyme family protein [Sporichthya polymorpha]|uniref:class I adenylate-forming enzyme family protein n=1 Tax=Sporichthya polymorpha TaxID=35751 RepID=UPI00036B071A|nr:fatty acid--CoA ligase family protein [Sporichthya polymorpha]